MRYCRVDAEKATIATLREGGLARLIITASIGVTALVAIAGCAGTNNGGGSINPNQPVGLPPTPPPASSNGFTGTQSPGLWAVSIDDTQAQFLYQAMTYPTSPNTPTAGSLVSTTGFLELTNANSAAGGYAVETPGRAVLLQPGNDTASLVFAVEQDSCFPINGSVRFQFVEMPSANPTQQVPAYGSIEAQTNADGTSWTFGGQAQYALPYNLGSPQYNAANNALPIPPGTTLSNGLYLPTFIASCNVSNGSATITASPNVSSVTPASTLATTFVVGPTGFFLGDQSTGKQPVGQNFAPGSFAGVIQPSSPLTTAKVVTAKYAGFMQEVRSSSRGTVSRTQPIGFGQVVAASGVSMTGGTFLNDDITQFQNTNIVINLGSQDPANNGLYTLASITVPDPGNVCVYDPSTNHPGARGTPGVDQYGNETCTFNAVAVVGNPENRYAIFIAATDVVSGLPMGMYLFQQ